MPFIGTRHVYRRQGMCRRLFYALDSALCSLKVEKLIIPAIPELMHTWTTVFGFTPLKESFKREMRSLNMLVFPGIDMLQKLLLEQEIKENITANPDSKQKELKVKHEIIPEIENRADIDSSTEHDSHKSAGSDLLHPNDINGVVPASDFDSKCTGVSSNSTSTQSGFSPAHVSVEGTCSDSKSADKLVESDLDQKCHFAGDWSPDALEKGCKPGSDSPVNGDTRFTSECDKSSRSASVINCASNPGMGNDAIEMQNKQVLDSYVEDVIQLVKEADDTVGALSIDVDVAAPHEVENGLSVDDSDDKRPADAPPFPWEVTLERTAEVGANPLTSLDGSYVSSFTQVERRQNSIPSSEAGSKAAHCEESGLHPSSDVPGGETESSSA